MAESTPATRLVSLDQFRGYTVAGMFLVNFIGSFAVTPALLKHHNTYCSYADTIMPQFLFAVGFAFRLALLRRIQKGDARDAYRHAVMRGLGLIFVGLVVYHLNGEYDSWRALSDAGPVRVLAEGFRESPWQALVHIGFTSLWVLPVIAAGPWARVGFAAASSALYLALSFTFYYEWVMHNAWDGGPLGFMTWAIPTIVGSLAYDVMAGQGPKRALRPLLVWAVLLMLAGYAVSCITGIHHVWAGQDAGAGLRSIFVEPPFVPPSRPIDIWSMCQRAGAISYLVFASGFSLAAYALFVVVSDLARLQVGLFRTLGVNALAAYVIHDVVDRAVRPFAPSDSPLWYATFMLLVFFGINYWFLRYLEKKNMFLRL